MTSIDDSLLQEHQWSGMFHPPEQPSKAFAGTLKFSPTEGISLAFLMPYGLFDYNDAFDCLHGSLMGGTPCTLVGMFKPAFFGMAFKNGYSYQVHREYHFRHAVFGAHCSATQAFEGFEFKITGLDEFFLPRAAVASTAYQDKPIVTTKIDSGTLTILHSANLSFLPNDLRSAIYTHDHREALEELQQAYAKIREKYENFLPYYKKTLSHELEIALDSRIDVTAGHNRIARIADLFSLFFMGPARIEKMRAVTRDQDGHKVKLTIFPSTLVGKETLDRARTEIPFDNLPINATDLDLAKAINLWESIANQWEMLISSMQNKGHTVARHETLSAILLSATQLEDLAYQAGIRTARFAYGPTEYATNKLRKLLCELMRCNESDVGVAISDLRNEIAHPLRPKRLLPSLNSRDLLHINYLMEAIIASSILDKIGLSTTSREKFQDRIVRSIVWQRR